MRGKDTILLDPGVYTIQTDGRYVNNYTLPSNAAMHSVETGPRQNGTFEGLTFSDDFSSLYVNVEEPLFEDGPRATNTETKSIIRIYRFDVSSQKNTAQFAYRLEAVAYPAIPEDAFKVNGVPDILYVDKDRLLVIERSFSTGRLPCTVKVFLADLSRADNVISIPSLTGKVTVRRATKKLLLNMDSLDRYIDNVEGMSWGPVLPNGHKTLIFVSDNNFQAIEKTQFFLFEVIP